MSTTTNSYAKAVKSGKVAAPLDNEDKGELDLIYDEGLGLRKKLNELTLKREAWEAEAEDLMAALDVNYNSYTPEQVLNREKDIAERKTWSGIAKRQIEHIDGHLIAITSKAKYTEEYITGRESLLANWSDGGALLEYELTTIEETRRAAMLAKRDAEAQLNANPKWKGEGYAVSSQDINWQEAQQRIRIANAQLEAADKNEKSALGMADGFKAELIRLRGSNGAK